MIKMKVGKFREKWKKKGYELINITPLCKLELGNSGWCNDFNEPDEECYHIKIWYRDELIANVTHDKMYALDDKYLVYPLDGFVDITGHDFIIFRKVKL